MTMLRLTSCMTLVLILVASSASAQPASDDGPGPRTSQPTPAPPQVLDATLQALRGRTVTVTQRSGACIVGEILGHDAVSITLALTTTRDIVTIARGEVAGLRLAEALAPAAAPAPLSSPSLVAAGPARERHFGVQLGLAPGLMLDYEDGYFYGFVHADVVLPMASTGELLGFSAGGGITFALASHSRWKMDVFAHLDPVHWGSDTNLGGGIGLGFHYTAANGFTLGFKIPILGYSGTFGGNDDAGSGVAFYYLGGVMGLPVISLGYRF